MKKVFLLVIGLIFFATNQLQAQDIKKTTTIILPITIDNWRLVIIDNTENSAVIFEISNVGGKILYKKKIKENMRLSIKINFLEFPNGEYFFQIKKKRKIIYTVKKSK